MMSTLICQRRNSDKIVKVVKITAPMNIETALFKGEAKPGQYLVRDGMDAYLISEQEFEDTYFIIREI